jgi:hypothetical protein
MNYDAAIKNFRGCRREYIGIESSTLSRFVKIYGAELSAILSPISKLFHFVSCL